MKRARIAIAIILLLAGSVGAWYFAQGNQAGSKELTGSGTIEAEEVSIVAEVGGRIEGIFVDEGTEVRAGDRLVGLDTALLEAQLKQAQAAAAVARANLALVQAGARDEETRQAKAALAQAVALRDGAKKAWENAEAIRANPQELKAKIDAAESQVAIAKASLDRVKRWPPEADLRVAEANVASAQANLDLAQQRLDLLKAGPRAEDIAVLKLAVEQARNSLWATQIERDAIKGNPRLPEYQGQVADAKVAAAETAVSVAEANLRAKTAPPTAQDLQIATDAVRSAKSALDSAQARLDQLKAGPTAEDVASAEALLDQARKSLANLIAMRDDPLTINVQVDKAKAEYESSKAAVEAAQAKLEAIMKGATAEQLAVARAQLQQAEAGVEVLEVQLRKMSLVSPISGLVTERTVNVGEMAVPGMRLLVVSNIDTVTLTLYIPENKIGLVRVGQKVEMTVDSFPHKVFEGQVVFISAHAEFTPKNVQTQKARQNLVFAVKVKVPNSQHELKPGMPADAEIRD
ncbi:MAG: efflux RND transporter periplasmic adaptor subunit [Chloroflexi bacterium]|nr:efflux RND transporter periplasmic adaptor subunit [Chloroflexota bacterium]MCL5075348.1 efflux RND transporter periplasmic adaptor subunit [Chloroflexota bacterium]